MNPDIQFFAVSGTWVKPAGAIRVDIIIRGADGDAISVLGMKTGGPRELLASSSDAADVPETIEVTVSGGGRPDGRDGYALIVTHLTGDEDPVAPLEFVQSSINLNIEHLEYGEGEQR